MPLTMRDRQRSEAVQSLMDSRLSVTQAAQMPGLVERQSGGGGALSRGQAKTLPKGRSRAKRNLAVF